MNIWILLFIIILFIVWGWGYASMRENFEGPGYYLIEWGTPSNVGGDPTITYDLSITADDAPVINKSDISGKNYQFKEYALDTTYTANITAKNSGGAGPAAEITFTTYGDPNPTILWITDANNNPITDGTPVGDVIVVFSMNNIDGVSVSTSSNLEMTSPGCVYGFTAKGDFKTVDVQQLSGGTGGSITGYGTTFTPTMNTCSTFNSGTEVLVQLVVSNPAAEVTTGYSTTIQ